MENILQYAFGFDQITHYFPVIREIRKFPRQYVCNVVHTVIGEPFAKWVANRITARNTKLAVTQNLNVVLDPKIAAAFAKSSAISRK